MSLMLGKNKSNNKWKARLCLSLSHTLTFSPGKKLFIIWAFPAVIFIYLFLPSVAAVDSLLLISLVRKWLDRHDGLERVPGQGLSTSPSEPGEIGRPTSVPLRLPLFHMILF